MKKRKMRNNRKEKIANKLKITKNKIILSITFVLLLILFAFIFLNESAKENRKITGMAVGSFADGDTPFYGMKIESVTGDSDEFRIMTTGAEYVLTPTKLEMWRRIDPHTNTINKSKVAELLFNSNIEDLQISNYNNNKREANITSSLVDFQFNSDSFFFIKAKGDFSYTHKNLISNAPWNKPEQKYLDKGLDRMWTDGYGGSLHAFIEGSPTATTSVDYTNINMNSGDVMGEMVYPPKEFNFTRLYGQNARPFATIVHYPTNLEEDYMDLYKNEGFGVVILWNTFYNKSKGNSGEQDFPYLLSDGSGIIGFEMESPNEYKEYIKELNDKGFKVIIYIPTRNFDPDLINQDTETTLKWMRDFQKNYSLDGWYFDNAETYEGNLLKNYEFIRQVRNDVGDDGIIFIHNSVDAWDGWLKYRGLKEIMIDVYADYTVSGETDYTVGGGKIYKGLSAQVDSPNDPYFRYFTSNYGMSQAIPHHILVTNQREALSENEKARLMGENLNGLEWMRYTDFLLYFKPAYNKSKLEYSSHPDVNWPLNPETSWFRTPSNINVEYVTNTSVNIKWETNELSDSNVSYTSNEVWWLPDGPDGSVGDKSLVTKHSITLNGIDTNKNYEFRIRSSNNLTKTNEIIWGYVGIFKISDLNKSLNNQTCEQAGFSCVVGTCNGTIMSYNCTDTSKRCCRIETQQNLTCGERGYYCLIPSNCSSSDRLNYECSSGVCCSKLPNRSIIIPQDKTCIELQGRICNASAFCNGTISWSKDSSECCLGNCETEETNGKKEPKNNLWFYGFLGGIVAAIIGVVSYLIYEMNKKKDYF